MDRHIKHVYCEIVLDEQRGEKNMRKVIQSVLAGLVLTLGLGINAANGAASAGFRLIVCSVSPFAPQTYLVVSSTDENDVGHDCEAVINKLVSAGFRMESVVTPGGSSGAVVVYNMGRRGRN
jgi:hypothetical protein